MDFNDKEWLMVSLDAVDKTCPILYNSCGNDLLRLFDSKRITQIIPKAQANLCCPSVSGPLLPSQKLF